MFISWETLASISKARSSSILCIAISRPIALPISRLLSSPRRSVVASSPRSSAASVTDANAASIIAWSSECSVSAPALSLKTFSAPTFWPSWRIRKPAIPLTLVTSRICSASSGHLLPVGQVGADVLVGLVLVDGVEAGPLAERALELVDLLGGLVGGGHGVDAAVAPQHQGGVVTAVDELDGGGAHGVVDGVVGLARVDDLGHGPERGEKFGGKRGGHARAVPLCRARGRSRFLSPTDTDIMARRRAE